jgi:hypothetical protein
MVGGPTKTEKRIRVKGTQVSESPFHGPDLADTLRAPLYANVGDHSR